MATIKIALWYIKQFFWIPNIPKRFLWTVSSISRCDGLVSVRSRLCRSSARLTKSLSSFGKLDSSFALRHVECEIWACHRIGNPVKISVHDRKPRLDHGSMYNTLTVLIPVHMWYNRTIRLTKLKWMAPKYHLWLSATIDISSSDNILDRSIQGHCSLQVHHIRLFLISSVSSFQGAFY
jgi:hypothetical protein